MITTTRVMLRIALDFVPPDYARNIRYASFGLCMVDVDPKEVPQLRKHPGVLGLLLPLEGHVVRERRGEK